MTDQSPTSPTSRRSFLTLLTAGSVTVGGTALIWPFVNSLNTQNTTITHSFVDVDISTLQNGQQITITWQGYPVFILHRSESALKTLQDSMLLMRLRDPESKELQQPPYTKNWHRSIRPEIAVLIGSCTHLGCVPTLKPAGNLGGRYHCACHGSNFDLAGRVYNGVPAPYNLPIPPYTFLKSHIIRIGENPTGQDFDFHNIKQI